MKRYLSALFRNNGVARGWLYVLIAFSTVLVSDLTALAAWLFGNHEFLREHWLDPVWWLIALVLVLKTIATGVAAALVSMRAYLDQHLSKGLAAGQTASGGNPDLAVGQTASGGKPQEPVA